MAGLPPRSPEYWEKKYGQVMSWQEFCERVSQDENYREMMNRLNMSHVTFYEWKKVANEYLSSQPKV